MGHIYHCEWLKFDLDFKTFTQGIIPWMRDRISSFLKKYIYIFVGGWPLFGVFRLLPMERIQKAVRGYIFLRLRKFPELERKLTTFTHVEIRISCMRPKIVVESEFNVRINLKLVHTLVALKAILACTTSTLLSLFSK